MCCLLYTLLQTVELQQVTGFRDDSALLICFIVLVTFAVMLLLVFNHWVSLIRCLFIWFIEFSLVLCCTHCAVTRLCLLNWYSYYKQLNAMVSIGVLSHFVCQCTDCITSVVMTFENEPIESTTYDLYDAPGVCERCLTRTFSQDPFPFITRYF